MNFIVEKFLKMPELQQPSPTRPAPDALPPPSPRPLFGGIVVSQPEQAVKEVEP